jgi:hypothetical protein
MEQWSDSMKVYKLKGVIDRVVNGVAAVVPNDGSREVYLPAASVNNAKEGMEIEVWIASGKTPNDLCRVIRGKEPLKKKAAKSVSYSSLLRAMHKTLLRLREIRSDLEKDEKGDSAQLEQISEKIDFLEKGLSLFRR